MTSNAEESLPVRTMSAGRTLSESERRAGAIVAGCRGIPATGSGSGPVPW